MTAAADTRAWQPWTPRVGDRVRVRLSPECPFYAAAGWRGLSDILNESHAIEQDGAAGVVVAPPAGLPPLPPSSDHPIFVLFDPPIPKRRPDTRSTWLGATFAACELQPLGDEDGPRFDRAEGER